MCSSDLNAVNVKVKPFSDLLRYSLRACGEAGRTPVIAVSLPPPSPIHMNELENDLNITSCKSWSVLNPNRNRLILSVEGLFQDKQG